MSLWVVFSSCLCRSWGLQDTPTQPCCPMPLPPQHPWMYAVLAATGIRRLRNTLPVRYGRLFLMFALEGLRRQQVLCARHWCWLAALAPALGAHSPQAPRSPQGGGSHSLCRVTHTPCTPPTVCATASGGPAITDPHGRRAGPAATPHQCGRSTHKAGSRGCRPCSRGHWAHMPLSQPNHICRHPLSK